MTVAFSATILLLATLMLLDSCMAGGSILLPKPKTVWTVTTDGKLQPGIVQWTSEKPTVAKAEISLRFGFSVGDANIAARASPVWTASNAIPNVKKSGANYSETDVSSYALTTVDGTTPLRNATRDTALLFTTNVTFLHVEVKCKFTDSAIDCTLNDDFSSDIDLKFDDGACWFYNLCSNKGSREETKCINFSDGYECVCEAGFVETPQQMGSPKCIRAAPGLTTTTLAPTSGPNGETLATPAPGTGGSSAVVDDSTTTGAASLVVLSLAVSMAAIASLF